MEDVLIHIYGFAHHLLSLDYSFIVLPLLGVWGFLVMVAYMPFDYLKAEYKASNAALRQNFIFNSRKEENGRVNFGYH